MRLITATMGRLEKPLPALPLIKLRRPNYAALRSR